MSRKSRCSSTIPTAPPAAPYTEFDTIEVSRRIEREAGSVYRINGRDVRQRDVQIFFADASSGAGSTAFVRQGQIGLLISQKPLARRAILEEAAGIGGLHQRRHEAELRLRAAETNLSRLEDVIREVEGQLASLKRQARQASRYRNLSGHIRKAEALAHYLRWTAAEARAAIAAEELSAAAAQVAAATEVAARASTVQSDAAAVLPPLRQTEAERGAAHHRLIAQREQLDAEEARAREAAQRIRQLIAQAEADAGARTGCWSMMPTARWPIWATKTRSLERRRRQRRRRSGRRRSSSPPRCRETLAETESLLERLTAELAEWNARKASLERGRDLATALLESSASQLADAQARLDAALEARPGRARRACRRSRNRDAPAAPRESARAAAADARAQVPRTPKPPKPQAREPLEAAEREVQRLSAEVKALGDLLHPEGEGLFPPLVDAVTVQSGYEAALAAALGDDLQAPLDNSSPHHWRDLGAFDFDPPLPDGVKPLSDFVKAPAALGRRLAMTGLVFPDQGAALQKQLKPGQRLVSARGDLWRWDGFVASADAPSPAAVRLSQRNRLTALEGEVEQATRRARRALRRLFRRQGCARSRARSAARRRSRRNAPPSRR